MIPENISKEHVIQAMDDVDKNGIRYPLTKSRKYELVYNNDDFGNKRTVKTEINGQ